MRESTNVLQYTTIGDLIKRYRKQAQLNITQLANLSGITKDVISKIELGDIKRPRLAIIKALARVIDIPYQEIIEHYIGVERRPEVLLDLLQEVIKFSDDSLISKVTLKFLQTPRQDTYHLFEKLFTFTQNLANEKDKILIYSNIVKYSREHGVMHYLAKGLFQKYLIERNDFSKLNETYQSGKYALHYSDFLSPKERMLLFYKLGVHAYNLRFYNQSIQLCEQATAEKVEDSGIKAGALGVICSAYFYLNKFDELQAYLDIYKDFSTYPFVQENVKILTAILTGRKGNIDTAIAQFQECLKSSSKDVIVNVVNRLFELYLEKNDLDSIENLIKHEVELEELTLLTPSQFSQVALFYKLKGDFYMNKDEFDHAIDCYIKSARLYDKVSAHTNAHQCLSLVTDGYISREKQMEISVLKKLQELYNNSGKEI